MSGGIFPAEILNKKYKSVLIFTFEDGAVIDEVKNSILFENVSVISKADITGKSVKEIISVSRKKKHDLLILSNRNAQLNRSSMSLKLLAISTGAKEIVLIFDDKKEYFSRTGLIFNVFPHLTAGLIMGVFLFIKTWLFFISEDLFYSKKNLIKKPEGNKLVYLRTDLAGKITAGGSLSHIRGFISGAVECGYEVVYISDFSNLPEYQNKIIEKNSLLDFFDELQLIDYHFRFIKEAKKIFKNIKPAVIYQRHSVFNASGAMLSRYFNVPLILEVNSSEVWVKRNWSRLTLEKTAVMFEKISLRNADVIGVVSKIVGDEIIPLGAPKERIVINPNGVNPSEFHPGLSGSDVKKKYNIENKIVCGFIGTFTKWHGVETLFEAAQKIVSQRKDIVFLFIGEGNLKINLEEKAANAGIKEQMIFTGLIPHKEAPFYLAACDILVSPHLGFETGTKFFGSPTKLFEYMAMGKAIVASDLEQIGEIIDDGFNGLKFTPGNDGELAEKIVLLANDSELRNRLGINARADVEKKFTWKMNAGRVLSLLKN